MVTREENDLMTRVEGDAPLGRLMRDHYWLPFALSENLVAGDPPTAVRLLGDDFVAFRAPDGRIGFLDERCPHRRASLLLGRTEGNGLRCIYHGWKIDVSGCVAEAPTQAQRGEQFARAVEVAHFPVHEAGGMAWVWLGGPDAPPFPDLPFSAEHGVNTALTISLLPCNWLQGFEGGFDSVHGPLLHQTWIRDIVGRQSQDMSVERVQMTQKSPPRYETEAATYGLRAASVRDAGEGRTYVRVANWYFPFVVVVPTGYPDMTQIFAFTPVDDTHHLLFFGSYGRRPQPTQKEFGALRPGEEPDPRNFVSLGGGRANRWGQNRELMKQGHFTGFDRSAIDEDAVVQVSMGPIVDRTRENLSSSDVGIAHARRLLLDTIASVAAGGTPPGSVRSSQPVTVPEPFDAMVEEGGSWREGQLVG